MKILLAWLVAACCIPVGLGLAGHGPIAGSVLVAVLLGVAAIAAAIAIAAAPTRTRVRHVACLSGAYALLLARGVDAGQAPSQGWQERQRGVAQPLRAFVTVAAGHPGPRCEVPARPVGSTTIVWLRLPAEQCPVGAGEQWWVDVVGPAQAAEPGERDPSRVAMARGAQVQVDARTAWPAGAPASSLAPWWGWGSWEIARLRQRAWQLGRGDDARAFVAASVLGVRAALAPERRRELRAAGLGHLVAISGLHVALASWLALAVTTRMVAIVGGRPTSAVVVAVVLVAAYVVVTGAPASAVRAGSMATLACAATVLGRPAHGLTSLAVAVTTMLALRPGWTVDPGFQLSVAAMAAVVTGEASASVVTMTWRVTWAIAPVSIVHFGAVSPWGCIANLVAIPVLTMWVLPLGLIGTALLPWFGAAAWAPAAWGAEVILDCAAGCDRLPNPSLGSWAALGLAFVAWRALRDGSSRQPAWNRARPTSAWVYVATAATVLWVGAPRAVAWPEWIAIGGGPRPWITVFTSDGDRRHVCVVDPPSSASRVLRMLDAFGVTTIGEVAPDDDPAGLALRSLAERRGLRIEPMVSCPTPDHADVVAALRRCGPARPGRPAAAMQERTGNIRCVLPIAPALLDFARSR